LDPEVSSPPLSLSLSLFHSPSPFFFPARPLLLPCARPRPSPSRVRVPPRGPFPGPSPAPWHGGAALPGLLARRCGPLPSPLAWRRGPLPGPGPLGVAPWRPCARPLPPGSVVPGVAPVRRAAPCSATPRGLPSAYPRAQPQRVRRSNFSLISFEFILMNVLHRATNEFKFRFISVVRRALRRTTN
jgi:hypothetical protein